MRGERGKIGSERAGKVFKTHSLHLPHSLQGLGQGRRKEEGVRGCIAVTVLEGIKNTGSLLDLGERRKWGGHTE